MSKKSVRGSGWMRSAMPEVTRWVDQLFMAFGEEPVRRQIRAGMAGKPVFYAEENGRRIGTPLHVKPERLVVLEPWHSPMPDRKGR